MALEAVTQQQQYLYSLLGTTNWGNLDDHNNGVLNFLENQNVETEEYECYSNWNLPPPLMVDSQSQSDFHQWGHNCSAVLDCNITNQYHQEQLPPLLESPPAAMSTSTTSSRSRRRRSRSKKNEAEIENQRMTHIAVERNRRKQMNEYLSVLRTLMPDSYVQRGDQASIVSGAINYVKELEQQLHSLSGQKHLKDSNKQQDFTGDQTCPFSEFFNIPQYSMTSATSDIEVTMVENHANLKIRSKKKPRLVPRIITGLECLRLTVLHLNVTKVDHFVLCSLSLKVEEDCKMNSVEDIAAIVNQILATIHQDD